jgi:hypothetical protein
MSYRLEGRRLYIADLAQRLHDMESGRVPMQPLPYRVLSKQLREALAGLPEPAARAGFAELPSSLLPTVAETLETRHFDHHGRLHDACAVHCRAVAESLFGRLRQRL